MVAILRQEKVVTLPARQGRFNPNEFFQTGGGLYVWDGFRTKIALHAKPVESASEMQLAIFTLTDKTANDNQIRAELPEGHVFEDVSTFCYYLAVMIQHQPSGADGVLLNQSRRHEIYANRFYVRFADEVLLVYVNWYYVHRKWHVNAYHLNSFDWIVGNRIFSATAVV